MMIFSILSIVLLFSLGPMAHAECDAPKSRSYLELTSQVDKAISQFSNSVLIASGADGTLSNLIKAKSPLVGRWINRQGLAKSTDEEIARAWRLYFAKNFILSNYPQKNDRINLAVETLVDKIIKLYSTESFKTKMETLFQKSKTAALEEVNSFKLEKVKKALITSRIQEIKLYWPTDLKSARNNKVPLDIIDWGVAYDPTPNEINMGLKAWAYPNDETYLAVFAHEIGHSIDPCRWSAYFSKSWPFEKVGTCLRTEKSAFAKKRDDSALDVLRMKNPQLALSLEKSPTCNKLAYPPRGLQKDQLPEAFADWFSAEVMGRMASGVDVKNLRSDLCGPSHLIPGSSYPSNKLRLEAIYKTQPEVAKKLKHKSKYQYCSLN